MDFEKEIDDYVLIQYIILFVLNKSGKNISYDLMLNIINDRLNINYIEFQLALDNLVCRDYVKVYNDENERSVYKITEKGKTSANLFEKDIPIYIREPIQDVVAPNIEKDRKNRLIRTKVRSLEEDMHYADCSVYDDDDTMLMQLSVFTPTRDEAVNITKKFKESPDEVYAKIITSLAD